jgi:DUF1365 family protein
MFENALYRGEVYHARHKPFFHNFRYRIFSLWINIDDFDNAVTVDRYFSFNRFNILSLYHKNHGARDGSKIRPWIERAAKEKGIVIENGAIYMLTFPSVLGFIFSPLTLYFCFDKDVNLKAILYQVKNTFGEQHGYLLATEQPSERTIKQNTKKVFHVSPFINMDCHYHFTVTAPSDKGFHIVIQQTQDNEELLTATWSGHEALPLNDKNILSVFFSVPFMGVKIVAAIHWQALKLWWKRAKFHKSPPNLEKDVT